MISWCTQGTTVYNNYHLVCAFFNCIIYHIVIKWFFLKVWITSGSLTDERKICWQTFNSLDAPDGYFSIILKWFKLSFSFPFWTMSIYGGDKTSFHRKDPNSQTHIAITVCVFIIMVSIGFFNASIFRWWVLFLLLLYTIFAY